MGENLFSMNSRWMVFRSYSPKDCTKARWRTSNAPVALTTSGTSHNRARILSCKIFSWGESSEVYMGLLRNRVGLEASAATRSRKISDNRAALAGDFLFIHAKERSRENSEERSCRWDSWMDVPKCRCELEWCSMDLRTVEMIWMKLGSRNPNPTKSRCLV